MFLLKRSSPLIIGAVIMLTTISCAQAAPAVKSETLMRTSESWDGVTYVSYPSGKPEISILKITVPPHTTLPWHTHPLPNAAYILSGHITVEKKSDGSRKTVHAGQTLAETVGTAHRGFTDTEAATLIVFYAGVKGLPLSEPVN